MKISILIPVYNAADSLPEALASIEAQNFDAEVEVIAVNDCGTDGSLAILEKYKSTSRHSVLIINQDRNYGVAEARNKALDATTGDYICWLDADDALSPDALSCIAQHKGADIIGFDWTLNAPGGSRYMRQPDCSTVEDALKALLGGTLRWNLWLFATKRELFCGVRFTPGLNMGEDMTATVRTLIKADNFAQIHKPLYIYRQTSTSISKTMSEENLRQTCGNVGIAEQALMNSKYKHLEIPYLDLLKLNAKLPLLVSTDKNDYLRWSECYPEASRSIMKNEHLPMRTKILQKAASKKMWMAVRLYNKLVYGILYKALLCRG